MLTYEGDISNYIGFNIKKKWYGIFELSQPHQVEKMISHVGLTVYVRLKTRDKSTGKPLLNKDESILGRKCICNTGKQLVY